MEGEPGCPVPGKQGWQFGFDGHIRTGNNQTDPDWGSGSIHRFSLLSYLPGKATIPQMAGVHRPPSPFGCGFSFTHSAVLGAKGCGLCDAHSPGEASAVSILMLG